MQYCTCIFGVNRYLLYWPCLYTIQPFKKLQYFYIALLQTKVQQVKTILDHIKRYKIGRIK